MNIPLDPGQLTGKYIEPGSLVLFIGFMEFFYEINKDIPAIKEMMKKVTINMMGQRSTYDPSKHTLQIFTDIDKWTADHTKYDFTLLFVNRFDADFTVTALMFTTTIQKRYSKTHAIAAGP